MSVGLCIIDKQFDSRPDLKIFLSNIGINSVYEFDRKIGANDTVLMIDVQDSELKLDGNPIIVLDSSVTLKELVAALNGYFPLGCDSSELPEVCLNDLNILKLSLEYCLDVEKNLPRVLELVKVGELNAAHELAHYLCNGGMFGYPKITACFREFMKSESVAEALLKIEPVRSELNKMKSGSTFFHNLFGCQT